MIIQKISNLFENYGACLDSKNNPKNIKELDFNKTVSIFEKYGIILFRNYSIDPKKFKFYYRQIHRVICRRCNEKRKRFDKKIIRNVDLGEKDILLHSEASFTPAWPEIIWFYCITPPSSVAELLHYVMGIKLWKSLSFDAKNFFSQIQ